MQHTQIDTRILNWLSDLQNGKSVPMGSLDNFNSLIAQKSTSFSAIGMSREQVYDLWFENHRARAELTFQEILASKPPNDGLKATLDQLMKVCEKCHDWHEFRSYTDRLRAALTDLDSVSFDDDDGLEDADGMIWAVIQGAQRYQISFSEMDISITGLRHFIRSMLNAAKEMKSDFEESDDVDHESDEYATYCAIAAQTFSSFDEQLSCIAR